MTLINDVSLVTHNANGVTTSWPYTFIIPDEADARVGIFDISSGILTPVNDGDYTISGIGDTVGGEVDYPLVGAPLAVGKRMVIWREVPFTQDTDLTDQTPYYPTVLENQLDRIVMQIQQLKEQSDRSFKVTQGSEATPDELIEQLLEVGEEATAAAAVATQAALDADAAKDAAELAADSIDLPAVPIALTYLRRDAANLGYEALTALQTILALTTGLIAADQATVRDGISAFGVIRRQTFTASGTYIPNADMLYCIVRAQGAGGGSGGNVGTVGTSVGSGGGGGGEFVESILTAADIGASKTVTIGAAGTAGAHNTAGGAGGDTSLAALVVAKGGSGSGAATAGVNFGSSGALGGTGGTGDIKVPGMPGTGGLGHNVNTAYPTSGTGGNSRYGAGGLGQVRAATGAVAGIVGVGYGAGAGGAVNFNTATNTNGAAGTAGFMEIIEFCSK